MESNPSWNISTIPSMQNVRYSLRKPSSMLILASFLRIGFQQPNNPSIKRLTRVVFRIYALTSTVLNIIVTFIGTSMRDDIHFITPFLIFLDHLSEMAWCLWLVKGATQGRKKLHSILTHLSNMGLMLLGAAILGSISRNWEIVLGVFFHHESLHYERADTG
jgi:hypothetical protein